MSANTPTSLASRLKQRYNKEVSQIVPVPADMQRRVPFRKDLEGGGSAEFDVQLAPELGFTQGTGASDLNGAIAQVSARASVSAYSLVLQSQISYDAISRAKNNEQAFARFADNKYIPMVESFKLRTEWLMLQGRQSLGKVTGNSSGTLTISADTFCPTMVAGLKGAVLEAYTALTGGSQHNGDLTVSAVDIDNRTITVTGTNAAVVANDHLFFKGDYDTGRIGLMHIAKNTGTLFGISANTFPLWRSNSFDVGTSALTLGKILQAAGSAAVKGCVGHKLVCYVPIKTFQSLVADEAALVQHAAGKKKAENGFETISFLGATGEIEVVPHLLMKEGEFVMWPEDFIYEVGSCQASNQLAKDGDIIFDLEGSMAKEMRLYSDTCGVFCERPGYIVYGTRSDGNALHT